MNISIGKTEQFSTKIILVSGEEARDIRDFDGKKHSITLRYKDEETRVYVSVGEEYTFDSCLNAAAAAVRRIVDLKRESVSVLVPKASCLTPVVEGALLGAYRFEAYKSEKKSCLKTLEFVGSDLAEEDMEKARIIAEATNYSRDLVNKNAGEIYPDMLAQKARELGKKHSALSVTVLDEKDIEKQGLNLLYAVGKGSPTPPRLIIMEYTGNTDDEKRSAVFGKGITFDSGGQNLKPSGSIENMRLDMGGAGAVLGIMKALCELNVQKNVIGVIPAAHNAIGRDSYFTGDVYDSWSGKTVEVLNTDAEGRLVLADALAYCKATYNPTEMIDLATLTGAILVALGDTVSGLFSNDKTLAARLFTSGEAVSDRVWELPIRDEHRKAMESDIADLRNISKIKRNAGSITAAAFLENFVSHTPWAHLDIAGTAWNDSEPRGITPKYATGAGVRLLVHYLTQ
ncbi:MAG: leucyl aminopeptidase family protein [Fibrobacterota bacterium]